MSLKSSLAAAKQLNEVFAALGEAEKVLTDAVKAESLLANLKKEVAASASEAMTLDAAKAKAKEDAAKLIAEAKQIKQDASDAALTLLADAKGQAIATKAKAAEDADKILESSNAQVREREAAIVALDEKIVALTAQAKAAEDRIAKAKAQATALLGG